MFCIFGEFYQFFFKYFAPMLNSLTLDNNYELTNSASVGI